MAKIMGLELKAVKTFLGSDGYGLNAILHLNGEKVAFVLFEGRGGELELHSLINQRKMKFSLLLKDIMKNIPNFSSR